MSDCWFQSPPQRFKHISVKQAFTSQLGKMLQNGESLDNALPCPYLSVGNVQWGSVSVTKTRTMYATPAEIERYALRSGDLLVCEGGEGGRAGVAVLPPGTGPVIFQNHVHRVRPRSGKPESARFLAYAMRACSDSGWLTAAGNGATIRSLSKTALGLLPIPWPDVVEQALIVRYLDNAELGIAKAIQMKLALIGKLEELAAVRRWHELTGGNRDGQLWPGVEWMGPLPSDFLPVRLKSIFSERTVRSGSGRQPLLSLRMREGLVRSSDYTGRPEDAEKLLNYKVVEPGQLVMNRMRASIGLFGVADTSGIVSPDYAVFDIRDGFHAGFMLLLLKTPQCGSVIRANSRGMGTGSSGFLRIYTDAFGRLRVAVPPLAEQESRFLKASAAARELEQAISALRAEVDLLGEYRVRLISDVVTGKKDVRAEAASMEEVAAAELASVLAGARTVNDDELGEEDDAE